MKHLLFILCLVSVLSPSKLTAQGLIVPTTGTARTRLYSADGPLAGPNILGQFFIGTDIDQMFPLLEPWPHYDGVIHRGIVSVPNIGSGVIAYVQLAAWDSRLWGNEFVDVPSDQLGYTDIIAQELDTIGPPVSATRFSQPAIVPIPEPSTWALGLVGVSVFLVAGMRKRSS